MKKSNIFWVLASGVAAALVAGEALAVTTVANVTVAQRPGSKLVDISYSVSSSLTNLVTVSVVISNGNNGILGASRFTGHIGAGVPTGTGRKIVWDGGADLNGQNLDNLCVAITASDAGVPTAPAGMVTIPDGSFLMGAWETHSASKPHHVVAISAFHMEKMEVSKALWNTVAAFAANNGYDVTTGCAIGKAADHPAVQMLWFAAIKWCNARSEMEGMTPCYYNSDGTVYRSGSTFNGWCDWSADGYRLPTEAEWEYAARGGSDNFRFPWGGNEIKHEWANYRSDSYYSYDISPTRGYHPAYYTGSPPYTAPVGAFAPNGYGLHNMAGNVNEWCWDWYSSTYYGVSPTIDPRGPVSGDNRVIRGGSASEAACYSRVGFRSVSSPAGASQYLGFRTARKMAPASGTAVVSAPFNADFRDYTLTVSSAFGSPAPSIGNLACAWHTAVTGTVQSLISVNGTNWICTGWTGTGFSPASGMTTNTGTLVLTNVTSTLTWQWAVTAYKPFITAQPQSRTNTYASTAVFSVGATSLPAATYQWRRNGVNLSNNSRISGAQSSTLTINTAQLSDAGQFSVVVSNAMGSVTSQVAVLTVNKAVLTVAANAVSRPYNTANPALSVAISGFVNGETSAVVSGGPFLSTTAKTNSNVGTYAISVSQGSLTAANYSFILVAGTLTVTRANQTVFFDCLPLEVTTRETSLTLGATTSSGLPVTYSSENQAVATVSDDMVMILGAGLTTIAAEQTGDANYLPAQTSQILVVVELTGFEKWADDNGLTVRPLSDLFAQDHNNNGIPNGFEYAFGANLAPGEQVLAIRVVNGRPIIDVPQQESSTLDFVDVQVEGCTDLLVGSEGWTLPISPASDTTGKPATRAWFEPGGTAPPRAFFRLKVELK